MKMTDTEYHHKVDEVFHTIENAVEAMIDEQDADIDVDGSGGVLELVFENGTKIVINKQEPLHEIWLATRFGGYHFGFDGEKWFDTRNQCEFVSHLEDAITQQSGLVVKFNAL